MLTEIMKAHNARSNEGLFRDLTHSDFPDFREVLNQLQACKAAGGVNHTKMKEVWKTVLQDSDLNGTYDLDISIPGGLWDKIIALNESLANVRAIPTPSHKIESNELTLGANGEDIWRPGSEGTDPGDTGTLDTANREFIPEEAIAIWGLTDHVLEDNIEHGTLESHVMRMMQDAASNEFAKAAYNGTKVGTANSSRGAITGMFDGFVQQINDAGNILYATTCSDRYVSLTAANDKFLLAGKLLPTKYGSAGYNWLTTRSILSDWNNIIGGRLTNLGDSKVLAGWWAGLAANGWPLYHVPALRSDYLVKGTGTIGATSPLDTQLAAIGKARLNYIDVDSIANAGSNQYYALGCDAAGTSFNLNAEIIRQSGTASGTRLTLTAGLARDHAIDEYVTEFTTQPTATGIPCLLTQWSNLAIYYQRQMRIEMYRQPRERQTYFIMTTRFVPIVINPDATAIIRDLRAY